MFDIECVRVQIRAMGAVGYVLLSSFLIRENILALVLLKKQILPPFYGLHFHSKMVFDLLQITINIHASLTFIFAAMGINVIPSMNAIYLIFGSLVRFRNTPPFSCEICGNQFWFFIQLVLQLLLNCGFFVFLLHILYSIFLSKLGLKDSLTLPAWMEKAIWYHIHCTPLPSPPLPFKVYTISFVKLSSLLKALKAVLDEWCIIFDIAPVVLFLLISKYDFTSKDFDLHNSIWPEQVDMELDLV